MNIKIQLLSLFIVLCISCNKEKRNSNKSTQLKIQKNYELVWSDEFDGTDINKDNWSFVIWDEGKVNNEWQRYIENRDNFKVENGILHITATKTGDNEKGGYTATRLNSKSKKEFKYGRIEFRAKMPTGIGTWPALWMLGSNIEEVRWPMCGEIDIMEYVGFQPDTTHTNVHTKFQYGVTNYHKAIPLATTEEEFHNYGVIWTKDSIKFYLDDVDNIKNVYAPQIKTAENWPFDQPFFIIMNFAVGGTWGGAQGVNESIWPQTMEVDYVRVYQLKPNKL